MIAIIKSLVAVTIAVAVFFAIKNQQQNFANIIHDINLLILLPLMLVQLLNIITMGLPFKWLTTPFCDFPFRSALKINLITFFLNQLLPFKGAIGYRCYYMKRNHDLRLTHSMIIAFANLFLNVGISAVIVATLWPDNFMLPFDMEQENFKLYFLLSLLATLIATLIILRINKNKANIFSTAISAAAIVMKNPKVMLLSVANITFTRTMTAICFYYAFMACGINVDFITLGFLVASINIINSFGFFTPGNIGVLELATAIIINSVGGDFASGFSAMVILRLVNLSWGIIISSFFSLRYIPNLLQKARFLTEEFLFITKRSSAGNIDNITKIGLSGKDKNNQPETRILE